MNALTKLAAEHDGLLLSYDALLLVLSRVASGEVAADRIGVDLQARTWEVRPQGDPPAGARGLTMEDLRRMAEEVEGEGAAAG